MERLPVLHRTKLNKDQTYFVNADDLTKRLADCLCIGDLGLCFSDDPSQIKSNYDRFVRLERKLVVLTARFSPWQEESSDVPTPPRYSVTVYAMTRSVREDLIAEFTEKHFITLKEWLNEKRDATWQKKAHSLSFLINLEDEDITTVSDLSFDDFARGGKEDGHAIRRSTIKRH